eukprot:Gregarina_sp_Poly_1__9855@NODE_636_length_7024_cov_22_198074_g485_i0_p6_GENE_NODE_636_length_7024_cov_22_198074_g485_i0NODE_636_length_7024_cov_22_198074_g485_i0_p6_ORF_typecomplete_len104_score9_61_NODE_636_length_7024_cov_22_198074_g485_i028093120
MAPLVKLEVTKLVPGIAEMGHRDTVVSFIEVEKGIDRGISSIVGHYEMALATEPQHLTSQRMPHKTKWNFVPPHYSAPTDVANLNHINSENRDSTNLLLSSLY